MAADCSESDYLSAYSHFFAEFVARVNPNDQLPVKVNAYDLTEGEIIGETINVTLQYLNQIYCPPSLQGHVIHSVIQEIKALCKKQPEDCGRRHNEKSYAPLKLMQAVVSKVNEICTRYTDNSRLALLPPPPANPLPLVIVGATRNTRRKMEDRSIILHDLHSIFNISDGTVANYYAVFDGHAGQDAAVYCATHLHQYLVESIHYPSDPERALRDAFLTTDAHFIKKSETQKIHGGTTAVCVLILNKKLYTAWVGDSMAMLVRQSYVKPLVKPHRPIREDEMQRVMEMGGVVLECMGIFRVNGILSVSRAIGDVRYKPYVTGDPDIHTEILDGTEDFVIIACDGFWDFVDFTDAASIVYLYVRQNPHDLKRIQQKLLQAAKYSGSHDNITVIVVFLTPPTEIAARPVESRLSYRPPNAQVNMETNELSVLMKLNSFCQQSQYDQQQEHEHQQEHQAHQAHQRANGADEALLVDDVHRLAAYEASSNGNKHGSEENGDADYDYEDLGPETDVDAVDEVDEVDESINAPASIDQQQQQQQQHGTRELFHDEKLLRSMEAVDDNTDEQRHFLEDQTVANDDFGRDERAAVDDDDSPPSPRITKPLQHTLISEADNVADSEDSEDEWDYYRIDPNKKDEKEEEEESTASVEKNLEVKNSENRAREDEDEDEEKKDDEEEERVDEEIVGSQSSEIECFGKCAEQEKESPCKLIDTDVSAEGSLEELIQDSIPVEQHQKRKREEEEEEMDFPLNPNAAEFIPVSPPNMGTRLNNVVQKDFVVSGSPLKRTPEMDDVPVPSQREFEEEVCRRPSEIQSEECSSNGDHHDADYTDFLGEKPKAACVPGGMDESEISSTKAEFGDESATSFLTATEFHRTGISTMDDSLEASDYDVAKDPMTMSFTPGDFETALSTGVDLNAVHNISGVEPNDKDTSFENNDVVSQSPQGLLEFDLNPVTTNDAECPPPCVSAEEELINTSQVSTVTLGENVETSCVEFDDMKEPMSSEFMDIESKRQSSPIGDICQKDHEYHTLSAPEDDHCQVEGTFDNEASVELIESPVDQLVEQNAMVDIEVSSQHLIESDAILSDSQCQQPVSSNEQDTPSSLSPIPDTEECTSSHPMHNEPAVSSVEEKKTESAFVDSFTTVGSSLRPDIPEFHPGQHIFEQHTSVECDFTSKDIQPLQEPPLSESHMQDAFDIAQNRKANVESEASKEEIAMDDRPQENLLEFAAKSSDVCLKPASIEKVEFEELSRKEISSTEFDNVTTEGLLDENVLSCPFGSSKNAADTCGILEPSIDFGRTIEEALVEEVQKSTVSDSAPLISLESTAQFVDLSPTEPAPEESVSVVQDSFESTVPKDILEQEAPIIQETCQSLLNEKKAHDEEKHNVEMVSLEEPALECKVIVPPVVSKSESKESLEEKIDAVKEPKDVSIDSKETKEQVVPIVPIESIMEPKEQKESTISENTSASATATATAAVAATAVATAAAATATATAKGKAPAKPTTKTTAKRPLSTKTGSAPTSPSKTAAGTTVRSTSTTTAAKKPVTSGIGVTTRSKHVDANVKSAVSSTTRSAPASKTTTAASKATTTTTTKATSSRPSSGVSKPKLTTTASKVTTSSTEKKPTTNGEVKSPNTTSKTASSVSKHLGKPSSTAATTVKTTTTVGVRSTISLRSASSGAGTTKPRPTSATSASAKSASTKPSGATSNVNSTTAKSKLTSATSTNISATTKTRVGTTGKLPSIDKQVKETANKQISLARTGASSTSRTTRTSTTITTTTAKRASATKVTTTASPMKKPVSASKVASKTSTGGTKSTTSPLSKSKVLQNGVSENVEITHPIITTATSNIEDDVPKKDLSPVVAPTDNQLIMTAD